jgi:hypothetical protein
MEMKNIVRVMVGGGEGEKKRWKKRNEEDEEKEKNTLTSFLISVFVFSSLEQCWGMTPACGVSSILLTYTHTHTHTTPILSERALSRNTPRLYIAPRYPWIGIRARDTRTHNAYKHTASLFPSYSFLSLSILARCAPRSHIGWEWLLMDITTRSSLIITLHRRGKCAIDEITFNGTC